MAPGRVFIRREESKCSRPTAAEARMNTARVGGNLEMIKELRLFRTLRLKLGLNTASSKENTLPWNSLNLY